MITFLPRRVSASMVVATAIATTAWWAHAHARDSPGASEVQPTAAGVLANPPDDARAAGPCLVPSPPSGIYVRADDDPIEVAVVDGCVAAVWPRVSARDDLAPQWGAVVAPQLTGVTATDDQREVVLRPDLSHIARAGDGLVLAVADDGALTVFTRGSRLVRWVSPGRALHRIAVLDDRRGARDQLLAHPDPTVAAAALTRAMQSPDADDCRAISAWLDRSRDVHHRDLITSALVAANAPCLVPAIRRALDEPALLVVASEALARLASPDAKAEAILAILDRPPTQGWEQATEALAQYLHPDHCGPTTRARCLSRDAAQAFENALSRRVAPNPPPEQSRAHGVLRFFDGSARTVWARTRAHDLTFLPLRN